MSEFMDFSAGTAAARTSLREEEEMAAWMQEHIAPTTVTFMKRVKAGLTADH
jgi:hypothetical protein